jgi:integrase
MRATTNRATAEADNLVPLPFPKVERKLTQGHRERFRIIPFVNATGTKSYRVTGTNRQGKQLRENFADLKAAQCRQVELTADWLGRQTEESSIRATKLTDTQLRIAESAFVRLNADDEMLFAVDHWLKHGKQHAVAESPRLDEAVEKFKAWLDGAKDETGNGVCTLRERSRDALRNRVNIFGNSIGNLRVSDITPDTVENFLNNLKKVSPVTRDNYRRAVSRFFKWCIQRPRRWAVVNPCREITIEQMEKAPPAIMAFNDCEALLKSAEAFKQGKLVPYVALCLFGGLRPDETARLDWKAVNLADREIRLEGIQTKTGKPRVVAICDTLSAWLKAYEGKEIYPANWRKDFDEIKLAAGYRVRGEGVKTWVFDVMRHTAISHYFRKTGSYGQTAEQFGNSEAIIKNHYQGRVNSDDTKKFYALRPKKGKK